MILRRLIEHYDRLAADRTAAEDLPMAGYSVQKIGFCVVLGPDGSLRQIDSLLDENARPLKRLVPGNAKPPGQGINPGFLWDNAAYMLGVKKDDSKPERTRASFEAFRDRHLTAESAIPSPAFRAVCEFLRTWNPATVADRSAGFDELSGRFGVFRIAGERRYVDEDPEVRAFWDRLSIQDEAWVSNSLVDGAVGPIARLHEPKIKGVTGAQTAGGLLVSFNDPAYQSFGHEQSYNAPVTVTQAFRYTNALNYLLGRRDRRLSIGDMTIVFWAARAVPLEDFVSDLLGDAAPSAANAPEDRRRAEQVALFLSQLRAGAASGEAIDPADQTEFYVLGLSPNASRLSVRLWEQTTVGGMKQRLARHVSDMALAGARDSDPPLLLRRIVQSTGRAIDDSGFRFDADAVSPLLAGAIARAVLSGGPYPHMLLTTMVNRLRADHVISHARVAAIKACLVRNSRFRGNPMEVTVSLDTNRSDPAYVMGRVFALLEKIQSDSAEGELNATIKDRYFSSASATPGVVLPRLVRLAQHHLAKLEPGRRVYYERQLGAVMDKLDGFAAHLNLENQGLFAVGYYHQRQDLYTKKNQGDSQ